MGTAISRQHGQEQEPLMMKFRKAGDRAGQSARPQVERQSNGITYVQAGTEESGQSPRFGTPRGGGERARAAAAVRRTTNNNNAYTGVETRDPDGETNDSQRSTTGYPDLNSEGEEDSSESSSSREQSERGDASDGVGIEGEDGEGRGGGGDYYSPDGRSSSSSGRSTSRTSGSIEIPSSSPTSSSEGTQETESYGERNSEAGEEGLPPLESLVGFYNSATIDIICTKRHNLLIEAHKGNWRALIHFVYITAARQIPAAPRTAEYLRAKVTEIPESVRGTREYELLEKKCGNLWEEPKINGVDYVPFKGLFRAVDFTVNVLKSVTGPFGRIRN